MENNENNLNQSGVDTNLNTTPVEPAVNTQPNEPIPNPFGIPNIEPQPVQPAPQEEIKISFGEPSVQQPVQNIEPVVEPVQNIEVMQTVEPTPVAEPVQNVEPTPVVEPVEQTPVVESTPVQNVEPVVVTQPTVETVETTQPVMEPVPELDPQQPAPAPEPVQKNNEEKPKKKGKGGLVFLIFLLLVAALASVYFFVFDGDINNIFKGKDNTSEVENKEVTSTYKMTDNKLCDFDLSFMKLENDGKNKVYSPISIKYALAMLKDGANGESKSQIEAIIGDYKSKKYTDSANMSFANAMFIRDTFKDSVKKTYTDTLKEKYNAEVIYDSFASASPMNKWVSDKTFNLIDNLFEDDKVKTEDFILTNALAINMEWKNLIQRAGVQFNDEDKEKYGYPYYHIRYDHEKFEHYIGIIMTSYHTLKFNDSIDAKSVELGADINNYDIVKTLGEENIRKTVGEEYKKWLETDEAKRSLQNNPNSVETDVNKFLDEYIKELNSNYKRADASTDFLLYDDENVKAFAKDLKEYNGTTLQYIGIMPKKDSLDNYVKSVSAKDLNNIITNLKDIKSENFKEGVVTKVTGFIPLFNFKFDLDLMNDLKKLGITDVFNKEKSDLSNLTSTQKAFIGDASHKATIEFTNEGIKAAAATQEGGLGAAGGGFEYLYEVPVEIIDLTFDKPYMFIIRDKQTGEVWFAGTVYEPVENK